MLFKNICRNTCGWKSALKCVKCCLKTKNGCLKSLTKHPLNHSKPQQKTANNHSAPYKAYLAPTKRSLENKSYWNSSRKPIWKVDVQYIYIYIIIKKFTTHIRWFQKNREKSPKTPRPATLMIWSPNLGIMSV